MLLFLNQNMLWAPQRSDSISRFFEHKANVKKNDELENNHNITPKHVLYLDPCKYLLRNYRRLVSLLISITFLCYKNWLLLKAQVSFKLHDLITAIITVWVRLCVCLSVCPLAVNENAHDYWITWYILITFSKRMHCVNIVCPRPCVTSFLWTRLC